MGQAASSGCCLACCDTGRDNLMGLVVRNAIMSYEKDLLGVDIHVGSVGVAPDSWRLEIEDLVLDNPAGYKSEYLLKASRLHVDLDGPTLLTSYGREATVQDLAFDSVELIHEPRIGTSNVTEVKAHLKRVRAQREQERAARSIDQARGKIAVTLHRVALRRVFARMSVGGFGPVLRVADITYEDFSQDFKGTTAVMDIGRILLSTVLRSVLHTLAHNVMGAGSAVVNGATASAKAVLDKVSGLANLKCVRPESDLG